MGDNKNFTAKLTIFLIAAWVIVWFIPLLIQKIQVWNINREISSTQTQLILDAETISGANKLIADTTTAMTEKNKRIVLLQQKLWTFHPRVAWISETKDVSPIVIETITDTQISNDFFVYLNDMVWTPYKWWQKFGDKVDCSGLFTRRAHKQWYVNKDDVINKMSAKHIYDMWQPKHMSTLERWDLIFFQKTWNHNYITHIAIVLEIWEQWIKILDAHPTYWVSKRWLKPKYTQHNKRAVTWNDWKIYSLVATTNFLRYMKQKYIYQWEFSVTSYIPTTTWMNINNWGKSGNHTASGLPLKDEHAGIVAACPKKYDIWLSWTGYDKLYIEWYGVVECRDRGWLITMAGEENKRGNIAKLNHIDIFAGLDTAKIDWNKDDRNIYLIK